MKKRLFTLLIIVSTPLFFSFQNDSLFPAPQIKSKLNNGIENMLVAVKDYKNAVPHSDLQSNITQLSKIRDQYKNIEAYFIYMYPGLDKAINGGAVPSFEWDVVKAHKDDPTGLQVIEEMIHEEHPDHQKIQRQCVEVTLALKEAQGYLNSQGIYEWEILEANRMELVKMLSMGFTGFDSPVLLRSIDEAKISFKAIYEDLQLFYPLLSSANSEVVTNIDNTCNEGLALLNKAKNFENFDRFTFTKDIIEPLYEYIYDLHKASGYEMYHEVSTLPRGFNHHAKGIFHEDFLNPYYSTRGNQTPTKEIENLGSTLFFDPILSHNNERSCASCHLPQKAFTDGQRKSIAFDFEGTVERNSPTIINSAYQNNFFWDMRSNDLNNQISFVAHSKKEFNTNFEEILAKLKASEEYKALFAKAYPKNPGISTGKMKEAIGAYVRTITGMNSEFDKYMRNEAKAPKEVAEGFNLFMGKAGCGTCHFAPAFNGTVPPHFNDTEGEVLGVPKTSANKELDTDEGRYKNFKENYPDMKFIYGMFKTPTVRNVALTAPYMHNGCYDSLEEVVEFYDDGGGLGLGFDIPSQTLPEDELHLSKKEIAHLIAFMESLTDTSGTTKIPTKLPMYGIDSLDNRKIGGSY